MTPKPENDSQTKGESGLHELACSASYFPGRGCTCAAHDSSECGCPDVDWTPIEVYRLRDTMAKMEYNHRYEREKMARVIRRLVRYADRVAERHPKAVTIHGQNARVQGGMWLAEFDRQNVESSYA